MSNPLQSGQELEFRLLASSLATIGAPAGTSAIQLRTPVAPDSNGDVGLAADSRPVQDSGNDLGDLYRKVWRHGVPNLRVLGRPATKKNV